MIDTLLEFVGTGIAVATTIIVIFLGRIVIGTATKADRVQPYYRQLFTFITALAGIFVGIAIMPVSAELRSQILSVLGILLSAVVALSSTNLVGNAMAGMMLRLMRSFRPGDFVEVGSWVGRVTEIGFFHTSLQVISRDTLAIPNTELARNAMLVTRRSGTFVNVPVSASGFRT